MNKNNNLSNYKSLDLPIDFKRYIEYTVYCIYFARLFLNFSNKFQLRDSLDVRERHTECYIFGKINFESHWVPILEVI